MFTRLFICCVALTTAAFQPKQDEAFYDGYQQQFPRSPHRTTKDKARLAEHLNQFRFLTNQYRLKTRHSFFKADTVYMINFYGVETGFESGTIWNKKASMSFRQINWVTAKERPRDRVIRQQTDASAELKSYIKTFRDAIEKIDTAAYHRFAAKHKVFDGESVNPIACIKRNGKWHFIEFPDDGWSINYDFEPPPSKNK